MKTLWLSGCVVSSLLVSASVQDPAPAAPQEQPSQGGLRRAVPPSAAVEQGVWRERLLAADLDQREQSFEQLVAAARRDAGLCSELEQWSRDGSERELAWTARLALRELRADPLQVWRDLGTLDLRGAWSVPLRRLEELQSRLDPLFGGTPLQVAPDAQSRTESFSLEVTPDGVKCKVTRKADGQDVTEEFSAPTLDELLEAHPELKGKINVQQFAPRGLWGWDGGPHMDLGAPFAPRALPPAAADRVLRTDILGVVASPITSAEAQALALEPGVGLRIERVEAGTIAHQLGLQRGQVLIEINAAPIRSRDDISAQIRQRAADGELRVTVIDRWGQRRTPAWKPDSPRQL